MTVLLIGVVIGLLIGAPLGRGWAEWRRARFDMRKTWDGRKAYRATKG